VWLLRQRRSLQAVARAATSNRATKRIISTLSAQVSRCALPVSAALPRRQSRQNLGQQHRFPKPRRNQINCVRCCRLRVLAVSAANNLPDKSLISALDLAQIGWYAMTRAAKRRRVIAQTSPSLTEPGRTMPSLGALPLPDQFTPVWWDNSISQCLREHPAVPIVRPEHVTASA
jgi:hypothetical protein